MGCKPRASIFRELNADSILLAADNSHPMKQVASAAGESRIIRVRSNHLIGYIIPLLCILLFILWAFYIAMLPVEKAESSSKKAVSFFIRPCNETLSVVAGVRQQSSSFASRNQ
jgi:hypothetical protein